MPNLPLRTLLHAPAQVRDELAAGVPLPRLTAAGLLDALPPAVVADRIAAAPVAEAVEAVADAPAAAVELLLERDRRVTVRRAARASGALTGPAAAAEVTAAVADGDAAGLTALFNGMSDEAVVTAVTDQTLPEGALLRHDDAIGGRVGVACGRTLLAGRPVDVQRQLLAATSAPRASQQLLYALCRSETALGPVADGVLLDALDRVGDDRGMWTSDAGRHLATRAASGAFADLTPDEAATAVRLVATGPLRTCRQLAEALLRAAFDRCLPIGPSEVIAALPRSSGRAHLLRDVVLSLDGSLDVDAVELFAATGAPNAGYGPAFTGRLTDAAADVAERLLPEAAYFCGRTHLLGEVVAAGAAPSLVARLPVETFTSDELHAVLAACAAESTAEAVLSRAVPDRLSPAAVSGLLDRHDSYRICDALAAVAADVADDTAAAILRHESASRIHEQVARRDWDDTAAAVAAVATLAPYSRMRLLLEPGALPAGALATDLARTLPDRAVGAVADHLRGCEQLPGWAQEVVDAAPASAWCAHAPDALGVVLADRLGDDPASWSTALELLGSWDGTLGALVTSARSLAATG